MSIEGPHGALQQAIKKNTGLLVLDSDFDGTVSDTITIPGDYPIVGLLIDLSDAATCTIQIVESGLSFELYAAAGTSVITLGDGSDTEIARFMPELAPFQHFTVTASATQTNAVIYGMLSS